ncbi:MAG: N-6 DNA methylase [Anaeromyxobacter sp.]
MDRALAALAALAPARQLEAAARRLAGEARGPLAAFAIGGEGDGGGGIDGALLEAIAARALGGARGAVFTPAPEARLLAAAGLAHAAARRGGPPPPEALAALLAGRRLDALACALDGLAVLDPACGGGALLAAAHRLAAAQGARLALHGVELAPVAARAARLRLGLLGAEAAIAAGDALVRPWPAAGLVLANPPFLRHEALPPAAKRAAVRASGLPAQADLSAHFAALALRRAPVAALVWPRALDVSRSAAPLVADAAARGAFALRLRSRVAGSFAASVDTLLAVWVEGAAAGHAAEAGVALAALPDEDLVALARGEGGARVRLLAPPAAAPRGAVPLEALSEVRFGTKTGCNAFFHLRPAGPGRYASALLGEEVPLEPGDVVPLLSSLREAMAPAVAAPAGVLLRPAGEPSAAARRYLARGEAAGVHRRSTCAGRSPWWRLVPGRGPAPLLYPAKVGARAFAFLNAAGLWEDKKWHALFPRGADARHLALVLSATPVRLAIDERARQLTGAQAIADVDTGVLARAPVPAAAALADLAGELDALAPALLEAPVTTDLAAVLARPAQRALDLAVGRALGLSPREVRRAEAALLERVEARLAHAGTIRAKGSRGASRRGRLIA